MNIPLQHTLPTTLTNTAAKQTTTDVHPTVDAIVTNTTQTTAIASNVSQS
jgi:hypothetical protein